MKPLSTPKGKYRSKWEALVALQLHATGAQYEPQDRKLAYQQERTYTPDFVAGDVYIEAKGYFPQTDRSKMLAVRRAHPRIRFILLFQDAAKKITATSKMSYGEWCTEHGFEWYHRALPQPILKDLCANS